MDIINSIEDQVKHIKSIETKLNLDAIVTHIKRAEHFYVKGKEEGDEENYTDVIYRTNQAFEGSLRQLYLVLTNQLIVKKDKKFKTIYEIERFILSETSLNERVLQYFTLYRQEWRNKSTHDFKLFFNEKEAFLAIVNVSAYTYLIFEQILEELSYQYEERKTKDKAQLQTKLGAILADNDLPPVEKLEAIIREYSYARDLDETTNENELVGQFSAFLDFSSIQIPNSRNKIYHTKDYSFEVDLEVIIDNTPIIVDIKNGNTKYKSAMDKQMLNSLEKANINHGIFWFPYKYDKRKIQITEKPEYIINGQQYYISVIKSFDN
ncbi:MAG: hypothetical protein P1U56_17440 [Saprospiraceae bacterium]|nr:hypothetical protein [Saprospiraceae bacterium]